MQRILNNPKNKRSYQQGQAIIWILAMLPVLFLSILLVYNSIVATREKMRLQNAADAMSYSGSVQVARTLNYLSYTNRAMAANEASIAMLASFQTSIASVITTAANVSEIRGGIKALSAASNEVKAARYATNPFTAPLALIYAGRAIKDIVDAQNFHRKAGNIARRVPTAARPTQVLVDALRVFNRGISASQTAMVVSTIAQVPETVASVKTANAPNASLSGENAFLLTKFVADVGTFITFYNESGSSFTGPMNATGLSEKQTEVMRFAFAAQGTRDDFTKERRIFPSLLTDATSGVQGMLNQGAQDASSVDTLGAVFASALRGIISWKGGTELVAENNPIRWASADGIELGFPIQAFFLSLDPDVAKGLTGLGAGTAIAGRNQANNWRGKRLVSDIEFYRDSRKFGGIDSSDGGVGRDYIRRSAADQNGMPMIATLPAFYIGQMHYKGATSIGTSLTTNWTMPTFYDVRNHPTLEAYETDNAWAQTGIDGSNPLKWGGKTDRGPSFSIILATDKSNARTGEDASFGWSADSEEVASAGLKDRFNDNKIKVLATSQVYFKRPQDRWARRDDSKDDPASATAGGRKFNFGFTGGYIEHKSLFSPYWQVHMVEPSIWARALTLGSSALSGISDEDREE